MDFEALEADPGDVEGRGKGLGQGPSLYPLTGPGGRWEEVRGQPDLPGLSSCKAVVVQASPHMCSGCIIRAKLMVDYQ